MRSFAALSILFAAAFSAHAVPLTGTSAGNPLDLAEGAAAPVEQAAQLGGLGARQVPDVSKLTGALGGLTGSLGGRQVPDVSKLTGALGGLTGSLGGRQVPDVSGLTGTLGGLTGGLGGRQVPDVSKLTGTLGGLTGGIGGRQVSDPAVPGALAKAEKDVPQDVDAAKADASALKADANPDVATRDVPSTQSVVIIFQNTWDQVTPLCQKLQYVNQANATVAQIKPVIVEIQVYLGKATTELKALVDLKLGVAVLLKGADGVAITVAAFARIVAINLIFLVRALVILVTGLRGDVKAAVLPLIYSLGNVVYGLIVVTSHVVVGLVAELTPLVVAITADLSTLGFVHLSALLKL